MKRIVALVSVISMIIGTAVAMNQASVPPKFGIPWGNSAGSAYVRSIPSNSQIGIQNCAASLTDGFPPLTFTPGASGGCPPFGQDFNGILKQLSQWSQWNGAGAAPLYDSGFASAIGGYPSGATLANASTPGCYWVSTVDANGSNPDSSGANWNSSCPGGGIGGTSLGSANAQVINGGTPIVLTNGAKITFQAGFTNSGNTTFKYNSLSAIQVLRRTQLGLSAMVGGEIVLNQTVTLVYNATATAYECQSCGSARVGQISDFAGSTAPAGTLAADGSCVSATTYAELLTVIGNGYGSCTPGSFALPDLRGTVSASPDNFGSNGNANRLNAACSGVDTTIGGRCGTQQTSLSNVNQLPQFTPSGTNSNSTVTSIQSLIATANNGSTSRFITTGNSDGPVAMGTAAAQTFTGVAVGSASPSPFSIVQPTIMIPKVIQY